MKIVTMKIQDLKPAPYNPRVELKHGDPEYEKLKRSIQEFGLVDPIIYNKCTGYVVGGHQRLSVIADLGITEVMVSVVDLPEEKEKALNVALNKISGRWDDGKLKALLEELTVSEFDIDITGFDAIEIDEIMGGVEVAAQIQEDNFDVDKAIEEIKEAVAKSGDIWQLGRHYLMCGDATNLADVERLMRGTRAEMIFTDPPYNVNYEGGTGLKIKNDNMDATEFYRFLQNAFTNMIQAMAPGGAFYICHADSEGSNFRGALRDANGLLKQTIIWVKNQFVMGRQDYQWRHEPILYGWKPGAAHRWYGGRKQSTVIEGMPGLAVSEEAGSTFLTFSNGVNDVVLKVPKYELISQRDDSDTSIWRFDKPVRNAVHPTMKPIGLCARAIRNSSKPGDIVADYFGGSGSTLMAAEQTNRICYTMDLDAMYCEVIVQRWEQYTGQKAIKLTA